MTPMNATPPRWLAATEAGPAFTDEPARQAPGRGVSLTLNFLLRASHFLPAGAVLPTMRMRFLRGSAGTDGCSVCADAAPLALNSRRSRRSPPVWLNGRKGLVTEYYEDRGRLGVRIDGVRLHMQPDVFVKMCNLKELGEEDFCPVGEEPRSLHLAKVPLLAPFDPNLVHILVRVRFRGELLFSAHGTWAPRAPRMDVGEGRRRLEGSHAVIDLAMTPAAPTLTTPATLFGHQEGMADEHTGAYGAYEAANDDAWLRRTDVARNEQLGTVFSEAAWGETQRQPCPATDAFQVDIRLVHVHPTCKKMHPTCKKGECEPRDMRWANLCTSARFRTEEDEMLMHQNLLPEESCEGDVYASGIIQIVQEQDHTKTYWRLSAALPFGKDYEPLSSESADGIFYREPGEPVDGNWLEVNFDLESILQPWSSSSQVHAVRSASLGIVWKVQGGPQDDQVGVMERVPSRIEFEGDTHGWQA